MRGGWVVWVGGAGHATRMALLIASTIERVPGARGRTRVFGEGETSVALLEEAAGIWFGKSDG